jgi:hypothetical protein
MTGNGDTPPEPAERGRYAVFEQDDGGLVIARAADLCDRCAACQCGEQRDPINVPGLVVMMARNAAAGKIDALKALRIMAGRK